MRNLDKYLKLAISVAASSDCLNRKVGCVLVRNDNVVSVGTNGPPGFTSVCGTCIRKDHQVASGTRLEYCRAIHAEAKAIAGAAANGCGTAGSVAVVTLRPCEACAKLMIASGVAKCYYLEDYPTDSLLALEHFLIRIPDEIAEFVKGRLGTS